MSSTSSKPDIFEYLVWLSPEVEVKVIASAAVESQDMNDARPRLTFFDGSNQVVGVFLYWVGWRLKSERS